MKCIVCGNTIKDGIEYCPICGTKQLGNGIYNTQQYTELQHQINNMHLNQNYNEISNGQYIYKPKDSKNKDIASLVCGIFGIYYSLSIISVINSGINEFLSKYLEDPKYAEVLQDPLTTSLCMTWPLFILSIIGLLFGISARKIQNNGKNTFGIISSVIVLAVGIVTTFYIYKYLIN